MTGLRLAPGPGIPNGLVIPDSELVERYSHAGGPGGQGVNTADSRVQLRFDPVASTALTPSQRDRLLQRLAGRADGTAITITASEHRSQQRNRAAARARLADLLRAALAPPPPVRRATRPSRTSVARRLEAKHRRALLKQQRDRPSDG